MDNFKTSLKIKNINNQNRQIFSRQKEKINKEEYENFLKRTLKSKSFLVKNKKTDKNKPLVQKQKYVYKQKNNLLLDLLLKKPIRILKRNLTTKSNKITEIPTLSKKYINLPKYEKLRYMTNDAMAELSSEREYIFDNSSKLQNKLAMENLTCRNECSNRRNQKKILENIDSYTNLKIKKIDYHTRNTEENNNPKKRRGKNLYDLYNVKKEGKLVRYKNIQNYMGHEIKLYKRSSLIDRLVSKIGGAGECFEENVSDEKTEDKYRKFKYMLLMKRNKIDKEIYNATLNQIRNDNSLKFIPAKLHKTNYNQKITYFK